MMLAGTFDLLSVPPQFEARLADVTTASKQASKQASGQPVLDLRSDGLLLRISSRKKTFL